VVKVRVRGLGIGLRLGLRLGLGLGVGLGLGFLVNLISSKCRRIAFSLASIAHLSFSIAECVSTCFMRRKFLALSGVG